MGERVRKRGGIDGGERERRQGVEMGERVRKRGGIDGGESEEERG